MVASWPAAFTQVYGSRSHYRGCISSCSMLLNFRTIDNGKCHVDRICANPRWSIGPVFVLVGSDTPLQRGISGLVAEYIVAIDVTRARFPADASYPSWPDWRGLES